MASMLLSADFQGSEIPVQETGRIKPLDTFARNQLLSMYSKRTLKEKAIPEEMDINKMSAVDWLFDITLHSDEADKYKVFNIRNPEIVGSLGLKWDTDHLYSRTEVLRGLQNQLDYIDKIQTLPDDQLTAFDKQMLHIYSNVIHFQELCYSFTCILDLIAVNDNKIAKMLNVKPGSKVSYYDVMQSANNLNKMIEKMSSKDSNNWSKADTSLSILLNCKLPLQVFY